MEKKQIKYLYIVLGFIFLCAFIINLGAYPLLDVDETRYADMAQKMFHSKDYLTLYLNDEYFFEKPPLFFWLECFSFKISGIVSELSARLPIIILSLIPTVLLIFLCRKVKDDKFAFISACVLFTSLEYIFMTKMAILDSVLTSLAVSSVFCYFYTFFTNERNKKYFWILTYIFSALAVLAKGIPGIAIPAIVIIISTIFFRTYKETLKYSWLILLFLLITLPWHIIMLKLHGSLFFDEYIIKHHILRFLGSDIIHRNEPWYFYLLTVLWGFFPHIFVLISQMFNIKNFKIDLENNLKKFLILNLIAIGTILIFFSSSKTKLITYILPIYPFLAVLTGYFWQEYIEKNNKAANISLIILNIIFLITAISLSFAQFVMPIDIYQSFKNIQIYSILLILPFVICNFIFLIKQNRFRLFISISILMALISGILTPCIYKFDYSFGQNDLMNFAKLAKDNNYTISTYLTGRRYSLLYYGNQKYIDFQETEDINWLNNELNKKNHLVIIRNKDINNLQIKIKNKGIKYSLIERRENEKQ